MSESMASVPQIFVQSDSPGATRKEVKVDDGVFKVPPASVGAALPLARLGRKLEGGVTHGKSMTTWMQKAQKTQPIIKNPNRMISLDELKTHNKRNDVWMAIKGKVFDVTDYVDYHPGGATYIMKGAGQDATRMFNMFHSYVNLDSILKGRQVGLYLPEGSQASSSGRKYSLWSSCLWCRKDGSCKVDVTTEFTQDKQLVKYTVACAQRKLDEAHWSVALTNHQDLSIRIIACPQEMWLANVKLTEKLADDKLNLLFADNFKKLTITLKKPSTSKHQAEMFKLVPRNYQYDVDKLEVTVVGCSNPFCDLNNQSDSSGGHIHVFTISSKWFPELFNFYRQLNKIGQPSTVNQNEWKSIGTPKKNHNAVVNTNSGPEEFFPAKIVLKKPCGENHYIFGIALGKEVHIGIPTLWHVSLKVKGLEKPYTPIPLISTRLREIYSVKADPSRGQVLYFYIKIYPTGKLTPMINSINLDVPNEIMVGDLTGSFDPEFLINTDRLILLAGGTGITPFISLIQFLMEKRNTYTVQQVVLVHSVAFAEQLLWPQALEAISKEGNWLYYYKHTTKSKNSPAQQNHHLDLPTMEGLLRKIPKFKGLFIDEPLYTVRAMACGPKGFLATSKSIFEFLGISQRNIMILS